ncbi:MAG: site-specific DNA-methyltransferase, partial [Gammaproteobacteria bacterium]|nr:site-specific DNA-methyltransferase [Gammaproteobacteria bacterium]
MKTDQIICGDAVKALSKFRESSVDLTVFSPPYDQLRDYEGYACDLHALGAELFRVTKDGGVVVMVIQDQTC